METQLDWSAYDSYGAGDAYAAVPSEGGAYGKAAAVCIGNRQCQRTEKGVMCPSFRVTRDAAHSTHHRAQTLKAALNGEYGPQPFVGPELDAAMDLCVGCKGCKRECPNGVDMALLRIEALAQRWKQLGGVPLRERLLAHIPHWAGKLARLNWLVRLRARMPLLARLGERWIGIAAKRSLPLSAPMAFLATAPTEPVGNADGREVVLLVDTFSNHFEPETAQAALDVLTAAGYRVHVARPLTGERPLCCGRTFLSHGLIEQARMEAGRMVEALRPHAERGLPVLGLEPSCLLMLRDEYYALGLGEAVAAVAKSALLLEEFLAREHDAKRLELPLRPLPQARALVHGHCHQKAFGAMKSMRKVLSLVPELQAELVESSCCGMAGAFGLEAEHYEVSMQMAELALLPRIRETDKNTLLIANGVSCRHQIRDGAGREGLHLARVLKAALAGGGSGTGKANAQPACPGSFSDRP
ncbi:(Fe-S)-binding protein [Methylococcus capsulatus]|jgi:glycerol-3-phosphate dehydrogenase subunit C|uniref:Glycerol-3-phosphate dehydrogenase subunit C n=1 Tax=Methylococcus capsulatus TaxID=414 RepID=A0AA35XUG0_METCP|nr:4Fe-4S dicluster domain-containing protein [Methylococcus capsulatus]QXP89742.1 4Fe-4S dicluster domain-containing protein [Methylococcus capsulatus]CAI8775297.1 glycerol-3-phosphate dehydrogenase subunit C [Methylococcus capsulatus]